MKKFLSYTLYIAIFTLLLPFIPLRIWWRSRQSPAYRDRLLERLGVFSLTPGIDGIWVHAVSVGEVIAAVPTIQALRREYPEETITVTTTTPTGSERVKTLLSEHLGDGVEHVYAPYDWPLFVWFFLRKVRPGLAIVMETELWPVSLAMCRLFGIPVIIANARLSTKSANGYYKFYWLAQAMLKDVYIAAQHRNDANRFLNLGADVDRVSVTGSVKFDVQVSEALKEQADVLKQKIIDKKDRFIWVAASTHRGEDEVILQAQQRLLLDNSDVLLVLVPRHPERFNEVADTIENIGLSYRRRSDNVACTDNHSVLLLDTMGELMLFYGMADMVFVGGSLVPVGGHNYLEPACWGLPVVSGPHYHNFQSIAEMLEMVGALSIVNDATSLYDVISHGIKNISQRERAGMAALKLLEENRGAERALLKLIKTVYDAE